MVKQLTIVPAEVRKAETIQLRPIPVNTYHRSLTDELASGRLTRSGALLQRPVTGLPPPPPPC